MARITPQPKYRVTIEFCDDDEESQEAFARAVKAVLFREDAPRSEEAGH